MGHGALRGYRQTVRFSRNSRRRVERLCWTERIGHRAPRIVLGGAACRLVPQFARETRSRETYNDADLRQALAALCA